MAKDWKEHNNQVFNKLLKVKANDIESRMMRVFQKVADDVIIFIEGANEIPIDTGNLSDSTGLGIYRNGVLTSYTPTKKANVSQTHNGIREIWGSEELQNALNLSSMQFSTGIWIVLFSAVPYAMKVDEKYNYFEDGVVQDLLTQFYSYLRSEFPTIAL